MEEVPQKPKRVEIGLKVWVLRSGGPVQEAVVASVMTVAAADGNKKFVKVEWQDKVGQVLGKTVPMDDVFQRLPKPPQTNGEANKKMEKMEQDHDEGTKNKACPICGLSFKGDRGLGTHIAKKHPREANSSKLRALIDKERNNKNREEGMKPTV